MSEETTEAAERDFTAYASKPITAAQQHFAEWVVDVTGINFGSQKEMAAFQRGVALGKALVMSHQKSPEWRERAAEIKAERAAAAPAAEEPAPAPPPAKKAAAKKAPAKKAVSAAAPATDTTRPPAKAATRRRAAQPAAATAEAPF